MKSNHSKTYRSLFNFLETFIQRQIMSYTIFPTRGSVFEIWKMIQNPSVDLFNGQSLLQRIFNCHEYQTRKWIGRFVIRMYQRIVRYIVSLLLLQLGTLLNYAVLMIDWCCIYNVSIRSVRRVRCWFLRVFVWWRMVTKELMIVVSFHWCRIDAVGRRGVDVHACN